MANRVPLPLQPRWRIGFGVKILWVSAKKSVRKHVRLLLPDVPPQDNDAVPTNSSVIIEPRNRHGQADEAEGPDVLYIVGASRCRVAGDSGRGEGTGKAGGRRSRGHRRDPERSRRRRRTETTPPRRRVTPGSTNGISASPRVQIWRGHTWSGRSAADGVDDRKGATPPDDLGLQPARRQHHLLGFERHVDVFVRPRGEEAASPRR